MTLKQRVERNPLYTPPRDYCLKDLSLKNMNLKNEVPKETQQSTPPTEEIQTIKIPIEEANRLMLSTKTAKAIGILENIKAQLSNIKITKLLLPMVALCILYSSALVKYSHVITEPALDTLCSPDFMTTFSICETHIFPIPDFTSIIRVQESLYDRVISQVGPDAISTLDFKKAELATRDLQVIIKHSTLASAGALNEKLDEYREKSRIFSRNLLTLKAQTKGVIDKLIAYHAFTMKELSDVLERKKSRKELRSVYTYIMSLTEKEAKRLILSIEKAQESLSDLEEDLYIFRDISEEEKHYQQANYPDLIREFANLLQGKPYERPLVEENLVLLKSFDLECRNASSILALMMDRMESFQLDLEELRSQIVAPIVIPDAIPLEEHVKNIAIAIKRLKSTKSVLWKSGLTIDESSSG
ncbi:hypothetical protein BDF14DRAFT_1793670 [Spinellus fusiger]|nr:hypothetical protein BDF14DRAFT_1793670 [Spinellus fusiger]